jgi:hypothetical protein
LITKSNGFDKWPEFLPFVLDAFKTGSNECIDTIIDCLSKIFENQKINP